MLTKLGGLFSSLSVLGMSTGKVFGYNLMLSSMIRKLYHFKPRFEAEVKKKKNKNKKGGKKDKKAKVDAEEEAKLKASKADDDHEASGDDIIGN